MTTTYHTPIPYNDIADDDTFNDPMGELDLAIFNANAAIGNANAAIGNANAAIGDLASLGTTTTSSIVAAIGSAALLTDYKAKVIPAINEVYTRAVAAQAGVDALETTVGNLAIAGGNVATAANGVSAAGQKVVAVDATTGFIVGSYVVYLLNGAELEGNVIASIQAGVSLTMTTNIGATPAGGVLDDSYISMISISEYLAAQAIPHTGTLMLPDTMEYANGGVFNVKAFGATGDGTTNDQAALEAAWAALSEGDTLVLSAGIYAVGDTVQWQNKTAITIIANNATIKAKTGVSFANKALVDMAGSQYCNVVGLRIDCALVANLPKVGLVLARTGTAVNGGANKFDNCHFSGSYAFSVVYDIGSELTSFWHCRFLTNVAGIPTYYTSSTDDAGIAIDTLSNVCKRWYDCTFLDYSNTPGQVLIESRGVTKELIFRDSYMALTDTGNCIELNGTGASMYGLVIDSVRVEGNNAVDYSAARLLYINQDNSTIHCEIKQVTWTVASDFVIEVAGISTLRYSNLSLLYPMQGTTKWMKVSNAINFNFIVVGEAETISIDADDTATENVIVSFGEGSPFTGAGTHDAPAIQTNITASLWGTGSSMGFARQRTEYLTVDSGATPSVKKRELLFMNYASPTTITDFADAVHGQTITLVTANGNITIDDGAIIKLKGSVNWTMPTQATLTLRELGGQWYEVGRMDPT